MTLAAGGKVDVADFGGIGGFWTSYTPTFTNITSGAGVFAYMLVGKTLFLRGNMTGGTATAASFVSISIPSGFTPASNFAIACVQTRTGKAAIVNQGTSNVEVSNIDGTNFAAAASLTNLRWTGVIEVA